MAAGLLQRDYRVTILKYVYTHLYWVEVVHYLLIPQTKHISTIGITLGFLQYIKSRVLGLDIKK